MSLLLLAVSFMVAAAACSDAARLEPKGEDPGGSGAAPSSGGAVGNGSGTATGGKTSTGSRSGDPRGPGGAGGGTAPWPSSGGFPASGGSWGTGGQGTGGTASCNIDEPISTQCSRYTRLCQPIHEMGALCREAAASGDLQSVETGCGFVHLTIGNHDRYGFVFGTTQELATGRIVEVFTFHSDYGCSYYSGAQPECAWWNQTTCSVYDGYSVDAGSPIPIPVDAGPG